MLNITQLIKALTGTRDGVHSIVHMAFAVYLLKPPLLTHDLNGQL